MSGLEAAAAVLELFSRVITVIEACRDIYDCANDDKTFHKTFRGAATNLLLILDILRTCHHVQEQINQHGGNHFDEDEDDDGLSSIAGTRWPRERLAASATATRTVLERCGEDAKQMRLLFDKATVSEDAGLVPRYAVAFKTVILRRRQKVDQLERDMLESLKLLQTDHYFRSVLESYTPRVDTAIEKLTPHTTAVVRYEKRPSANPITPAISYKPDPVVQRNYGMFGGTENRQFNAEVIYLGKA